MNGLFLGLLAAYVVRALIVNRRPQNPGSRAAKILVGALHIPLFALACYFGAQGGVFSRELVSPIHVGAGLLGGHLIFLFSLLITYPSWKAVCDHFLDLKPLWHYMEDHPEVLMRFIAVSVGEELIYRVAAQPLLIAMTGSTAAGLLIVSAVFCVVHRHFFRNPFLQSVEFVGFAILLGVVYYATGSLILVIVIHAVRNIEITYLEDESDADDDSPAVSESLRLSRHVSRALYTSLCASSSKDSTKLRTKALTPENS